MWGSVCGKCYGYVEGLMEGLGGRLGDYNQGLDLNGKLDCVLWVVGSVGCCVLVWVFKFYFQLVFF